MARPEWEMCKSCPVVGIGGHCPAAPSGVSFRHNLPTSTDPSPDHARGPPVIHTCQLQAQPHSINTGGSPPLSPFSARHSATQIHSPDAAQTPGTTSPTRHSHTHSRQYHQRPSPLRHTHHTSNSELQKTFIQYILG